ncbi:MAG TPA: SIMPL domain-containing protein, partial [Pyrinomonadaceae bacterium]
PGARATTRVIVTGDAVVQAQPDTAVLTLAVVTQNASASEAQAENASRTEAVVRAVRAAAGAGAEVKTSGYSLQPQYAYKEGAPPTITSYVARNGVTLTTGELGRVGAVIDAASRAGANSVDGLAFTLRRDEQARQQALADATREASAKARVIAQTLGGRVVRIVEVQESGSVRPPVPVYAAEYGRVAGAAQATSTPIESGSLEIRAQVQIVAEVEQQ